MTESEAPCLSLKDQLLIEPDQPKAYPPDMTESEAPCLSLEGQLLIEPDQPKAYPPDMTESEASCLSLEDQLLIEPDQPRAYPPDMTESEASCLSVGERPPSEQVDHPPRVPESDAPCLSPEERPHSEQLGQLEDHPPHVTKSNAPCCSLEDRPPLEELDEQEAQRPHMTESDAACMSLEDPHKQEVVEMQEQLLFESLEDITFGAGCGASVEAEVYAEETALSEQEACPVEAYRLAVEQNEPVEACNGEAELSGLPPIFEEDQQCHVYRAATTLVRSSHGPGLDCSSGSSSSSASASSRRQRRTNRSLLARRCEEAGKSIVEPCTNASEWAVYLMREVDRLSRRLEALEAETLPTFQRSAFEAIRVQDARLSSWSGTAASAISLLGEENHIRRMEIEALSEQLRSSVSGHDQGRAPRPPLPDSPPWHLLPEAEVERLIEVARQAAADAVTIETDRFALSLSRQANGILEELNNQHTEVLTMLECVTQEANSLRDLHEECLSKLQGDAGDSVAEEGTAASIRKALQVRIGRVGDEETTFPAKPRPTRLRVPSSPTQAQLAQDMASTLAAVERSASFRSLVRAEVQQVCKELQSMDSEEVPPKPWSHEA